MADKIKIDGKDVLLFLDLDGGESYKAIVCLDEQSFGVTSNVIDANSKCGPDTRAGVLSNGPVPFAGQFVTNPENNEVSAADIFTAAQAQTTVGWKIAKVDPQEGDPIYEGKGFFSSFEQTFPKDDVVRFTGEISVMGTITQTITGS